MGGILFSVSKMLLVYLLLVSCAREIYCQKKGEQVKLIMAVNAGGPDHMDVHGIFFKKDPLTDGVASDHGMQLNQILRSPPQDEILYRTERYSLATFAYTIPIPEDGKYVLVMMFCEVYFQRQGQKVFDIFLNEKHKIVSDLDIFAAVGYATAHQEAIPFEVAGGTTKLIVDGVTSAIKHNKIRLEFLKGSHDNPKVNAFFVIKGSPELIAPLPEFPPDGFGEEEDEEEDWIEEEENDPVAFERKGERKKVTSGPITHDPWEDMPLLTTLQPILIAGGIGFVLIAILYKCLRQT